MSKGGTFDHQYALERLPVPQLKDTLETYCKTLIPFGDHVVQRNVQLAKDFLATLGPRLQ